MKLFISFSSLIVAIMAPITVTASVGKIPNSGLRHLSAANPAVNEVCFPSPKSYSQPEVVLLHSLASHLADDSWTGVTAPGEPIPDYAVGCGLFDFKCYVCELCEKIYGALVDTGSDGACDVACIGIAEAAGGGPEDPIADAVAAACIPLCEAVFSSVGGGTAESVCKYAHLC